MKQRGSFTWAACVSVAVFVVSIVVSGPVRAFGELHLTVEAWDSEWSEFSDDFEDGQFPDAEVPDPLNPGMEAPAGNASYFEFCGGGEDSDAQESGGVLLLEGVPPTGPCAVATAVAGLTSGASLQVTFVPPFPSFAGTWVGMTVGSAELDASGMPIEFAQIRLEPVFPDLLVKVQGEDGNAQFAAAAVEDVQAIELRLELTPVPGVGLLPQGSFRSCPTSPCEDGFAFVPVDEPCVSGCSADQAALAVGEAYRPSLIAFTADAQVEQWSFGSRASDDFTQSTSLDERVGYQLECADETSAVLTQEGLELVGGNSPCDGVVLSSGAQSVNTPDGSYSTSARFELYTPERCGSYGLAVGNDELRYLQDVVALRVVRSEDPTNTALAQDVLSVRMHSEFELFRAVPLIGNTVISDSPGPEDPNLEGFEFIELRLDLDADAQSGELVPTGSFRLCPASGCDGIAFEPLDPVTGAGDINEFVCGVNGIFFGPPADGTGAITTQAALLTTLGGGAPSLPDPDDLEVQTSTQATVGGGFELRDPANGRVVVATGELAESVGVVRVAGQNLFAFNQTAGDANPLDDFFLIARLPFLAGGPGNRAGSQTAADLRGETLELSLRQQPLPGSSQAQQGIPPVPMVQLLLVDAEGHDVSTPPQPLPSSFETIVFEVPAEGSDDAELDAIVELRLGVSGSGAQPPRQLQVTLAPAPAMSCLQLASLAALLLLGRRRVRRGLS